MEDRKKLAFYIIIIALFGPIVLYLILNSIVSRFRPTDWAYVKPREFERAFNAYLAPSGLSIDLDDANYSYNAQPTHVYGGVTHFRKILPVHSEDGSALTCSFWASSDSGGAFINDVQIEQTLTNEPRERVYMPVLLDTLLHIFQPTLAAPHDEPTDVDEKRERALAACYAVLAGDQLMETMFIDTQRGGSQNYILTRTQNENEQTVLLIRMVMRVPF